MSTDAVPGEARLEARLIAPCCWTQTLDVHGSPIAAELRGEIRSRLIAGEPPDTIEESIVARYGERIRAVPRGQEVGGHIPQVIGVLMLLMAAMVAVVLRRWLRAAAARAPAALTVPSDAPARDAYDARLDEELRALDE
jgi:cytochrome c-type biogenesis protein CcmH